jgi:hypothetical protein
MATQLSENPVGRHELLQERSVPLRGPPLRLNVDPNRWIWRSDVPKIWTWLAKSLQSSIDLHFAAAVAFCLYVSNDEPSKCSCQLRGLSALIADIS